MSMSSVMNPLRGKIWNQNNQDFLPGSIRQENFRFRTEAQQQKPRKK